MNTTPIRPCSGQRHNFQRPLMKWWNSPESVLKGIDSNNDFMELAMPVGIPIEIEKGK